MEPNVFKRICRLWLILSIPAGWGVYPAAAQASAATDQVKGKVLSEEQIKLKEMLKTAQQAYAQASYLGFHIMYTYANDGQLSNPMDSLSGDVQMDKGRCRFIIDGTETVVTGKYVIRVMDSDKSIYLSSLSSSGGTGMADPLGMIDTVFAHMDGLQAEIGSRNHMKIAVLRFPPGQAYSQISMEIDEKTGYFHRISYSLYTVGLVGQDLVEQPNHPGPYKAKGQIDILFSGYEQGRFGDSLFDEGNFFHKVAGRFDPAGRYKDYHIFLASSNL